ncbi:hypothetical protein CEXT_234501 [Caerostris extrusa]|uniref:Uncharacterized protein n=1 Tax=Caerostris extrusa TaxID=172846 RepID=A0AAV4N0T3_CAEEX|nr:hypothetical protein CEXT_234501 [Caerostris extrusa]
MKQSAVRFKPHNLTGILNYLLWKIFYFLTPDYSSSVKSRRSVAFAIVSLHDIIINKRNILYPYISAHTENSTRQVVLRTEVAKGTDCHKIAIVWKSISKSYFKLNFFLTGFSIIWPNALMNFPCVQLNDFELKRDFVLLKFLKIPKPLRKQPSNLTFSKV